MRMEEASEAVALRHQKRQQDIRAHELQVEAQNLAQRELQVEQREARLQAFRQQFGLF